MSKRVPMVPLTTLGIALDEIYRLRTLLAYEAEVIDTHLNYKTFPKSRREIAIGQVERMRWAAKGHAVSISHLSERHARESAGMSHLLTRAQWEAEKGIS